MSNKNTSDINPNIDFGSSSDKTQTELSVIRMIAERLNSLSREADNSEMRQPYFTPVTRVMVSTRPITEKKPKIMLYVDVDMCML